MITRQLESLLIGVILAAYLLIAGQYAARTPDWQAPDEPAHYNYIRQIADEHKLPRIARGDWDQEYLEGLKASKFAPQLLNCAIPLPENTRCPGLEGIQYEDHQPPLYYLLQAPVFAATEGDLVALRLVSVLLGAGVVLLAWLTLRAMAPRWPVLALTGAGLVAFIPQHLAILGSVNNDALAGLIVGLTLWATVRYLAASAGEAPHPAMLGLLAGVAMITKTTIYFLGGIVVLAVLLRWRRERWPWRVAGRHLAAALIPALVIGGMWWARNLAVYGGLDFAGLDRHDEVVIGQLRTADYIERELGGSTRLYLENAARTTAHSFWGQFGWMAVPMPQNVYRLLGVFTLGALAGWAVLAAHSARARRWPHAAQRDVAVVFAAVLVLTAAQFVLYNLTFVQFQGRYLYPALIPIVAILAIGLSGWAAPLVGRWPALGWLPLLSVAGLAALSWYALNTYVVPNL